MKVLGIDTSAIVCSVALVSNRRVLSQKTLSDGLTHSETLLPLVKETLSECGMHLNDLDGIAISNGPGSFTGLRIGISTVKGLAVSAQLPCVGVSTLEALALNAIDMEGYTVCALMDARRGEFYNAIFRIENGKLIRLCEDRAIHGSTIAEELQAYQSVLLVGDGAEKFSLQFSRFAENLADEAIRFQSGKSVALLGLSVIQENGGIHCRELSPKYLRLPQAEREWNEKHQKKKSEV